MIRINCTHFSGLDYCKSNKYCLYNCSIIIQTKILCIYKNAIKLLSEYLFRDLFGSFPIFKEIFTCMFKIHRQKQVIVSSLMFLY